MNSCYVNDYDVFIKKRDKINDVEFIFNDILQKYGLLLNDSKTKIEEFPYYTYIDYNRLKESNHDDSIDDYYSVFGQLEKQHIQNGAILFFSQHILSERMNSNISLALTFSILKNVSKSLTASCKNIL